LLDAASSSCAVQRVAGVLVEANERHGQLIIGEKTYWFSAWQASFV
jgi:hypothetical protein